MQRFITASAHFISAPAQEPASEGATRDANPNSPPRLPAPHPSLACGLGRARAGSPCRVHAAFLSSRQHPPRRARSKPFAPAISVASFLALLLGAGCICATGILNAGPRFPGLCAVHDAALLVCLPLARRRASTPCMHIPTWRSLAGPWYSFFLCVVVCRHTLPRTAPQSYFLRSVYARDACLQAAHVPCEPDKQTGLLYAVSAMPVCYVVCYAVC